MAKIDDKETTADEGKVAVKADREKYVTTKSASGAKSLHNNDEVAQALDGLTLEEVQTLADKLIKDNDFRTRYANLNPGMQRMNIGNRLRGWLHKQEDSTAFDKAAAPLRKAADKRIADAEKAKAAKAKEKDAA